MKYAWPLTEFLKQHAATFGIPAEVSDAHSYAFTGGNQMETSIG